MAEGPPSELRTSGDTVRVEVDDRARATQILANVDGASVVEDAEGAGGVRVRLTPPATAAGVNAALVGGGVAVSALSAERASLEDVFMELTEGADVPR